MSTYNQKETSYVYDSQGVATTSSLPATETTPTGPTYISNPYTSNQTVTPSPGTFDNTSPYDNTKTAKVKRLYSKVENALRKKFDSTSGPSYRSDPLGGYTAKGPGYYEKKHKFTRRITKRGNPPPIDSAGNTLATPVYSSATPAAYNDVAATPTYTSTATAAPPVY